MKEYHKIDTIFKRDMNSPRKTLIVGDYSQDVFAFLANNIWTFTEKVDGTNIRVLIQNGAVTFGGRTDNALIPAKLVERLQDRFGSQAAILNEMFPEGACLYGEGYGAKIQSGGNYRPDQDFVLFDVRIGEWWLQRDTVAEVGRSVGCDVVPIIGQGTLADAVHKVQSNLKSQWGDFQAEGIVARPQVELHTRNGARIIAKIKCRDFAP